MSEKKLFLLDGHALVYRSHYAFISRPLINSKGLNTSAIMGFTNVLRDLIKREDPSHLAVCFDLSGPTFRNEIFEDYKACLLYTSPSPRDKRQSRMPSSA